jgi:hypothetical protein
LLATGALERIEDTLEFRDRPNGRAIEPVAPHDQFRLAGHVDARQQPCRVLKKVSLLQRAKDIEGQRVLTVLIPESPGLGLTSQLFNQISPDDEVLEMILQYVGRAHTKADRRIAVKFCALRVTASSPRNPVAMPAKWTRSVRRRTRQAQC